MSLTQRSEAITPDTDYMTIGALAAQCGVTVRTLRYYEEMDLIGPVKRTSGKYRLYNKHSLKRVNAILALQDLGYALEEIVETLGAYSQANGCAKSAQIALTERSLALQQRSIEGKLKQLRQMKKDILVRVDTIEHICKPCMTETPDECCPQDCQYIDVHD